MRSVKSSAVCGVLVVCGAPAIGGVGVEWHAFDVGVLTTGGGAVAVSLPGFDSIDGSRVLVGVDVVVETVTDVGHAFENPLPSPWVIENVHAGWSTSVVLTHGYAVESVGPGMDSGVLALGPADGVPMAGPDFAEFGVGGYVSSGGGVVDAPWVLGGFSDGDGGLALVSAASLVVLSGAGDTLVASSFTQAATLRVGFLYAAVPSPGGGCAIGLVGALSCVRRRPN